MDESELYAWRLQLTRPFLYLVFMVFVLAIRIVIYLLAATLAFSPILFLWWLFR